MSAEADRVFSGARRTISWERASLSARTIERLECLKNWLKSKYLTEERNEAWGEGVDSRPRGTILEAGYGRAILLYIKMEARTFDACLEMTQRIREAS